ncbi:MAG: radical SAM protein [Oscillospiraceae bacterium]|nr:radical SAM protein [Oscillospiraceae bacterium]
MKRTAPEPHIMTYLHQKGRALGLPIAGTFELTPRCNFNCPMCYIHMTPEQQRQAGIELTAQQWLQLARDARDAGMLVALLTGGEPLVRKDFFEIYSGMKKLGLMVSVNTNGSMLQGEILEKFLADPPARFNISLYGGCNETYEKMCGLPMYDRVRSNIANLRKAGIEVSLNLSITPYNCQDLEKIFRDAMELDVNIKASSYMYPPVRVQEDSYGAGNRFTPCRSAEESLRWDRLRFTPEEFKKRMENTAALAQLAPECSTETDPGVRCRAGSTSFWLTWDGKMLPCGMMPRPIAYPLEAGFAAAWETIRNATAALRLPSACTTCPKKPVCPVCAAVCVTETGAFDQVPHYLCQQVEETVRLAKEEL